MPDEILDTTAARVELGRRMTAVVDELLRGRVPDGFDEVRARNTGRILANKRVDGMTRVRPEIKLLPLWRPRAVEFVLATPNDRCSHWDWQMFTEWIREQAQAEDREWIRLSDVLTGRERRAVVHMSGRRYYVRRVKNQLRSTPRLPV